MEKPSTQLLSKFNFEGTVNEVKPLGGGLINDTFFVTTEGNSPNYILQRKNKKIFTDIPSMMQNIEKVTTHLKKKIVQKGGDPLKEALTVTKTKDGQLYYQDQDGEYWAACLFIEDTVTYHVADTPQLAMQGGKGIGQFQSMLSDMDEVLVDILPGFHNMRFRLKQWDEVIQKDPVGRKAKVAKEIEWVESRRDEMMKLWVAFEKGEIPVRITHNDTKISNILFDQKGDVLCVIDLDTVLSSTCLNDYGDAIRSYTNTAAEDEIDLNKVEMKMDIFEGYTEGYISETASFLNDKEKEYLAFSAKYITYEQLLRFLMDYIDGDNYYKVKNDTHNLVRTHVQYKLLQCMENNFPKMEQIVTNLLQKHSK